MKDVMMPQLGETADEAEVITWLKDVGDEVARGDALLEVQTDKITVEIPALDSGVLREVLVQAGDVVMVGAKIARLEPASSSTSAADNLSNSPTDQTRQATQVEPPTRQTFSAEPVPAAPNKLRASPSARRVARELGVTLADVTGTGPRGRITSDDVRAASTSAKSQESGSEGVAEPVTATHYPDTSFHAPDNLVDTFTDVANDVASNRYHLTAIERTSAQVTAKSFAEIPHFYVTVRADATALMRWVNAEMGVSVNDALVSACGRVLKDHPRLNASLEDARTLTLHEHVNIGVITATPYGVVTSVVPDAERLTLADIHQRVREVRSKVAAGRATASDISGATFAISNLGMYGVEDFSAIILPPNVAMLAVGSVREDVFVERGALRMGHSLSLTLSADHRAVDGVAVALFLNALRDIIQAPQQLFSTRAPQHASGVA
jgi:pyruvate dehydrogenase E2 component (dihydrolipoamide acetyltransferase)